MIDVKQAVKIAKEKAVELIGHPPTVLEEIEREDYKGHDAWSITLSFPAPNANPFDALARGNQYRRFLIDLETGELLAIKLREVAAR